MSELLTFARLGFRHITDPGGLDHVLFVVVLAAGFRPRDWRGLLAVVSAFTVGHTVTLALTVLEVLRLPAAAIELLIPITIVVAALENVARAAGAQRASATWRRAAMAGVFGLVHGAGFANYLRSLFVDDVAVPLLGFNLGLEAGQVAVLAATLALLAAADRVSRSDVRSSSAAPRGRVIAVSAAAAIVALAWTVQRVPW